MTNKPTIKETIVVEGKTDADKLLNLFNVNIITTNGSACSNQTIAMIKSANQNNGVILFLDPDYVGEQIRKKITNSIPCIKQAFIDAKDVLKNKKNKIGIAEASDESIINAINKVVTFDACKQTMSLQEYNELNLDSRDKRLVVCNHYNISYCNNKQLFKRLNMLGITYSDVQSWQSNENSR